MTWVVSYSSPWLSPTPAAPCLENLGAGQSQVNNRVGPCADPHLLWHLELSALPVSAEARDTACTLGSARGRVGCSAASTLL
jgi:hypothetical protein